MNVEGMNSPKAPAAIVSAESASDAGAIDCNLYGYGEMFRRASVTGFRAMELPYCPPSILTNNHQHPQQQDQQPYEKDYPPMPADRWARKQGSLSRRGGATHSTLLKSAVLAAMDAYETDSEDDPPGRSARRESIVSLHQESLLIQEAPSSPRKRARKFGRGSLTGASPSSPGAVGEDVDVDEDAVSSTSRLLGSLTCSVSDHQTQPIPVPQMANQPIHVPVMPPPPVRELVRRVSRRTSYDSRISSEDDLEDMEDLFDDDN